MATGEKTGGRKQGTPNKLTTELREVLKDVLTNEIETIPTLLNNLDSKDRLQAIIKLMPFVFPKVTNINMTTGEPIQWEL